MSCFPPAEHLRIAGELAHRLTTTPEGPWHRDVEHHLARAAEQLGEPLPRIRQDLAAVLAARPDSEQNAGEQLATCVMGLR